MGEVGGEMASRPGGQPAAEGGELEGLGEEPQAVPLRPQLVLQLWAEDSGLHERGPAGAVDLQNLVHRAHVQADHTGVVVAHPRFDAAHHRGAAAEGDDRDTDITAPVQDADDLVLRGGAHHEVGHVGQLSQ